MSRHISVDCTRESETTFALTIREDTQNLLIGYAEITLVPVGARILATNADDSDVEGHLIVHAEVPS